MGAFPGRSKLAIGMKLNHEKRRLYKSLRDPYPHLHELRREAYAGEANFGRGRSSAEGKSKSLVEDSEIEESEYESSESESEEKETPAAVPTKYKAAHVDRTEVVASDSELIAEMRHIQDELKQQRNETRILIDYVTTVSNEVRQLRHQYCRLQGE